MKNTKKTFNFIATKEALYNWAVGYDFLKDFLLLASYFQLNSVYNFENIQV